MSISERFISVSLKSLLICIPIQVLEDMRQAACENPLIIYKHIRNPAPRNISVSGGLANSFPHSPLLSCHVQLHQKLLQQPLSATTHLPVPISGHISINNKSPMKVSPKRVMEPKWQVTCYRRKIGGGVGLGLVWFCVGVFWFGLFCSVLVFLTKRAAHTAVWRSGEL